MVVEEMSAPVAARSGQSRKEVALRASREKKYFGRGKRLWVNMKYQKHIVEQLGGVLG